MQCLVVSDRIEGDTQLCEKQLYSAIQTMQTLFKAAQCRAQYVLVKTWPQVLYVK